MCFFMKENNMPCNSSGKLIWTIGDKTFQMERRKFTSKNSIYFVLIELVLEYVKWWYYVTTNQNIAILIAIFNSLTFFSF